MKAWPSDTHRTSPGCWAAQDATRQLTTPTGSEGRLAKKGNTETTGADDGSMVVRDPVAEEPVPGCSQTVSHPTSVSSGAGQRAPGPSIWAHASGCVDTRSPAPQAEPLPWPCARVAS